MKSRFFYTFHCLAAVLITTGKSLLDPAVFIDLTKTKEKIAQARNELVDSMKFRRIPDVAVKDQ